MKKIEFEEYQNILLNELKAFTDFCNKNGIVFLLGGGTAIGAVRHKGFIPWDDDIDIFIFKKDFDKLVDIVKSNPYVDEEKRYKLLLPAVEPNYYPFFKLIDTKTVCYERNVSKKYATGAWIDVFCLSYWSDNEKKARKQFKKEKLYETMNKVIIGGNYRTKKYKFLEIFARPVRALLLLLGKNSEYWCRKILSLDKYTKGKYVGNVCWPFAFEKERYKAEWFDELVDIQFEDIVCKIEKDYDKVLSNFYGDYMTMPPVEKQERHAPEAYYIDE